MSVCWHCGAYFIPSVTGACAHCGHWPNKTYVEWVKTKKLEHQMKESNIKSWGGDRDYRTRKRWSLKD